MPLSTKGRRAFYRLDICLINDRRQTERFDFNLCQIFIDHLKSILYSGIGLPLSQIPLTQKGQTRRKEEEFFCTAFQVQLSCKIIGFFPNLSNFWSQPDRKSLFITPAVSLLANVAFDQRLAV